MFWRLTEKDALFQHFLSVLAALDRMVVNILDVIQQFISVDEMKAIYGAIGGQDEIIHLEYCLASNACLIKINYY